MSKTGWLLVLLLVGSNVAWLLLVQRKSEPETFVAVKGTTVVVSTGTTQSTLPTVPDTPDPPEPVEPPVVKPDVKPKTTSSGAPSPGEAFKAAKPLIDAIRQGFNAPQRKAALDSIRSALTGDAPLEKLTALSALSRLGGVKFDVTGLREPILNCVSSSDDPYTIRTALYALSHTDRRPEDLDRVIAQMKSEKRQLRQALGLLIVTFADRKVTGKAAQAILVLLDDENASVMKGAINAFEGAEIQADVEARLLELARTKRHRAYTVRFALSRLAKKSAAVVDELIAAAGDPDSTLHRWAVRGLRHGVAASARPRVVATCLQVFHANPDPKTRDDCLETLRLAGDEKMLPDLEKIIADAGITPALRQIAERIAAKLRPPEEPKDAE